MISHSLGLVSIKAFIGLTRKFSVLKLTGYSYSTMTSYISKSQGKVYFSVHDPFNIHGTFPLQKRFSIVGEKRFFRLLMYFTLGKKWLF